MLQQDEPGVFVLGTGESHSIHDFLHAAAELVGVDYRGRVIQDERYMRPSDVPHLCADPRLAKEVLGWEAKTKFHDLVKLMVEHDLATQ
jgi:GDPmannose 4,6-dehydratase